MSTMVTKEELDELLKSFREVAPEDIQVRYNQQTQDLARELVQKTQEVQRVEDYLLKLQSRIKEISMFLLPDLFHDQDITKLGIANGVMLELLPYFKASLPVGMDPVRRESALSYLREKAPEILKTEISFSWGRHEHNLAEQTIAIFQEFGFDPKVFEGVHHATLTAWVKEQFLAGKEIPLQTLNARIGSIVKIQMARGEDSELFRRLRDIQNESLNTDSAVKSENQGEY